MESLLLGSTFVSIFIVKMSHCTVKGMQIGLRTAFQNEKMGYYFCYVSCTPGAQLRRHLASNVYFINRQVLWLTVNEKIFAKLGNFTSALLGADVLI